MTSDAVDTLVVDVAAGTARRVPLTPAERVDVAARAAEAAAAEARRSAHARALAEVEPGVALVGRLRTGLALERGDLERLVRWLALELAGPG